MEDLWSVFVLEYRFDSRLKEMGYDIHRKLIAHVPPWRFLQNSRTLHGYHECFLLSLQVSLYNVPSVALNIYCIMFQSGLNYYMYPRRNTDPKSSIDINILFQLSPWAFDTYSKRNINGETSIDTETYLPMYASNADMRRKINNQSCMNLKVFYGSYIIIKTNMETNFEIHWIIMVYIRSGISSKRWRKQTRRSIEDSSHIFLRSPAKAGYTKTNVNDKKSIDTTTYAAMYVSREDLRSKIINNKSSMDLKGFCGFYIVIKNIWNRTLITIGDLWSIFVLRFLISADGNKPGDPQRTCCIYSLASQTRPKEID